MEGVVYLYRRPNFKFKKITPWLVNTLSTLIGSTQNVYSAIGAWSKVRGKYSTILVCTHSWILQTSSKILHTPCFILHTSFYILHSSYVILQTSAFCHKLCRNPVYGKVSGKRFQWPCFESFTHHTRYWCETKTIISSKPRKSGHHTPLKRHFNGVQIQMRRLAASLL